MQGTNPAGLTGVTKPGRTELCQIFPFPQCESPLVTTSRWGVAGYRNKSTSLEGFHGRWGKRLGTFLSPLTELLHAEWEPFQHLSRLLMSTEKHYFNNLPETVPNKVLERSILNRLKCSLLWLQQLLVKGETPAIAGHSNHSHEKCVHFYTGSLLPHNQDAVLCLRRDAWDTEGTSQLPHMVHFLYRGQRRRLLGTSIASKFIDITSPDSSLTHRSCQTPSALHWKHAPLSVSTRSIKQAI